MKAVIDTNVAAYFALGTAEYAEESRRFLETADELWAPAVWEAEFANVVWMAARHKMLSLEEAVARLTLADGLGIHSVPIRTLWQGALVRSYQAKIAVYDTLFVELAAREKLPLATFDAAVLRAFPEIAVRPSALAAS